VVLVESKLEDSSKKAHGNAHHVKKCTAKAAAQKSVLSSRSLHVRTAVWNFRDRGTMPILSPEEKVIIAENTRHKGVSGELCLTNKRLIFQHRSGIITKRIYVTLDLPLEGVDNVAVEGLVIKHLTVYAKKGFISSFPAKLDFSVNSPDLWHKEIMGALGTRLGSIERREKIEALSDFGALKDFMVKGGLMLQTVKCPECGGPIKLPESGNQTRCDHCGNTILAQDIFEKIKGLI